MVLYCRWFFRSGSIRGFMLNGATWTIAQISTCRHFSDRILNISLCISLRMKMEALWLADAMRWWRQPGRAGYNFRKGGAEGCRPLSEPCGAASKEWLPRTSIWEGRCTQQSLVMSQLCFWTWSLWTSHQESWNERIEKCCREFQGLLSLGDMITWRGRSQRIIRKK